MQTSLYRMIVGYGKYFQNFVTKNILFRLNSRECLKEQFIKQKLNKNIIMKSIFLTSILAVLSLTSVVAGNPKKRIFSNIENHNNGCTKEYVIADKNLKPDERAVFECDTKGKLLTRIFYKWDAKAGLWTTMHKHDYDYNDNGRVANVVYTRWDNKQQAWSSKSQHSLHVYDGDGKLLSVQQIDVNGTMVARK